MAMTNVILTGERGCGKTTVCAKIVKMAQSGNLSVKGIITLPRYQLGKKVGLDIQDVATGDTYPLAEMDVKLNGPAIGCYYFHGEGIRRGNELLNSVGFCDVLVIDELGPLELVEGQGWHNALDVLKAKTCRLAVVVARPTLVNHLVEKLDGEASFILNVTIGNRDKLPGQILGLL